MNRDNRLIISCRWVFKIVNNLINEFGGISRSDERLFDSLHFFLPIGGYSFNLQFTNIKNYTKVTTKVSFHNSSAKIHACYKVLYACFQPANKRRSSDVCLANCCFDWQTICLTGQADWGLVLQYKEPNESQEGQIRRWPFNIWP